MVAHERGVDAVAHGGRTAALDVAEHGGAGIDAGGRLDLVGQLLRADDALRHDDDEMLFAGGLGGAHALQDIALESNGRSGSSTASAPVAMPTLSAMYPAWWPMTSTTLQRSWLWVVSRSLSMASTAVFMAVS